MPDTHSHIIHAIANSFVLLRFEANKSSVKLIVTRPPSETKIVIVTYGCWIHYTTKILNLFFWLEFVQNLINTNENIFVVGNKMRASRLYGDKKNTIF